MAAVLKASDNVAQMAVQSFIDGGKLHWPPADNGRRNGTASTETEMPDEPAQAPDETVLLKQQIDTHDEQIAQLRAESEEAEAKAFDRGLKAGEARADELAQAKLQLLQETATAARADLAVQLAKLEELALQLSTLSLEKIFGADVLHPELVAHSIRHRVGQLSSELVVGIRVSAADFPDAVAVAALVAATDRADISLDGKLASGDCIIDLKLGHFDIGVGSQWQRLHAFLDSLRDDGVAT